MYVPRWLCRWWLCLKWSREQRRLCAQLLERDDGGWSLDTVEGSGLRRLRLVGGMDVSFFADPQTPNDVRAIAALLVCELDCDSNTLEVVWERYDLVELREEYIAGFLAFREVKHLRALIDSLRSERPDLVPDVVLVDGNGVLHPRGFGLASHLGVTCDLCTVGVGKDLHLIDGLNREQVKQRLENVGQGGHVELVGQSGRVWGAALLPRLLRPVGHKHQAPPKNPIYVSVGHRMSLHTSVELVKRLCISARVPEPVRLADVRSRERVREVKEREKGSSAAQRKAQRRASKDQATAALPPIGEEPRKAGEAEANKRGNRVLPFGLFLGLGSLGLALLLLRARRSRA